MGTLEQALSWIFLAASSCEGGMLQGRGGSLTPGGYVDGWLKELACPHELPDKRIKLYVGKSQYGSDPISAESAERAVKMLSSSGFELVAGKLAAGETVPVTLHQDAALLAALYGGMMGAWRIMDVGTHFMRNPSLGYKPVPKAATLALPAFLKVDRDSHLVQKPDGSWRCEGWAYSIIGSFIRGLWKEQLKNPGSYKKHIKAFREAINNAPMVPQGTKIVVDLSVPMEDRYMRDCVEQYRKECAVVNTDKGYTFEVPTDPSQLYRACQLPAACTQWVLPDATPALRVSVAAEQLSLLEA